MGILVGLVLLLGVLLATFAILKSPGSGKRRSLSSSRSPVSGRSKTYTLAQVKKHNTRNDCWIVIKDKVYDVSSYVEEHPGGDAILNNAGSDSTEGFYGPQHVSRVFEMIGDYYVGELES